MHIMKSFRFERSVCELLEKLSKHEFRSQNAQLEYLINKRAKELDIDQNVKKPLIDPYIEPFKKPKKSIKTKEIDEVDELAKWAIDQLNEIAGTNFNRETESTKKEIKARINDKTLNVDREKILSVIKHKVKEWKGTNMEKYIRPSTLFNGKFAEYLAEAEKGSMQPVIDEKKKALSELKALERELLQDLQAFGDNDELLINLQSVRNKIQTLIA